MTVIDQGAQLAAIQAGGLKLVWEDGSEHTARVKAVESAAQAGPQDLVILAVKAHFLDQVVREIDAMLEPDTMIMTVQNGLPWWYFQGTAAHTTATSSRASIPRASWRARIDPDRVLGCVVYPAAHVAAPGVIHHAEGDLFRSASSTARRPSA